MNHRLRTTVALAALVLTGAAACTDITTEPTSTVTASNIFNDPASYKAFLAKIYGGLQVTGQQGPAGNGDINGIDEGFSQYLRQYWQLQELPTDEAIIAWGDQDLPELNTQLWGPGNAFIAATYYRIYFQVALVNEFLKQTTDAKLAERNASATLIATVHQYRAEARYLRALSYWHGIDLFGNIPLVDENYTGGVAPPPQATRQQVYDFAVSELTAIQGDLPAPGQGQYGRADRGAALMLLAKLYLNSQVYTGTARNAEALNTVQTLINSGGYTLDPSYRHLFQADNHTSKEIIFPVPFDGRNTRTFGGTTFLVHAGVGGDMNPATFGINGGWWGLRLRPEAYLRYSAGDKRTSYFFTQNQTVDISSIGAFQQGVGAPKYTNVTSGGQKGSNEDFVDTDFPMFRLGDAYLMYAEAQLRGGGGTRAQALAYVNALRQRAYGDASGNITDAQLTLDFIRDERGRELLWEGHRRTDLVRFGLFTSSGVWSFKGNVKAGVTTPAYRNLYPIPTAELGANPNLTQNPGYPVK